MYRLMGSCEIHSSWKEYNPVEDHQPVLSARSNGRSDDDLLVLNQAEITQSRKYEGQLRYTLTGRKIIFPDSKLFS